MGKEWNGREKWRKRGILNSGINREHRQQEDEEYLIEIDRNGKKD